MLSNEKIITVPINYGYEYIRISDIEYIEADNSYSTIYLNDGQKIVISKSLKYFENALSQFDNFLKVHRSFVINLNYVKSFYKENRGMIVLKSNQTIKLSPNYTEEYIQKMNERICE
ncbi:MAG TPA: LytTR family DNA-binding domain-containing protein [Crocinitomicaceae bacterium]|nr:LytTR family DNA-binding domain-containing protein [Crocinitomicaceae bacterium]